MARLEVIPGRKEYSGVELNGVTSYIWHNPTIWAFLVHPLDCDKLPVDAAIPQMHKDKAEIMQKIYLYEKRRQFDEEMALR
jgi:hypothetical protein